MLDGHPFRQDGLIAKGNSAREGRYPTSCPTGRHRLALVGLVALALAGCGATPIENANTGNPGVSAGLIAHVGGCDLYRVWDSGSRVYLSVCPAGSSRAQ